MWCHQSNILNKPGIKSNRQAEVNTAFAKWIVSRNLTESDILTCWRVFTFYHRLFFTLICIHWQCLSCLYKQGFYQYIRESICHNSVHITSQHLRQTHASNHQSCFILHKNAWTSFAFLSVDILVTDVMIFQHSIPCLEYLWL